MRTRIRPAGAEDSYRVGQVFLRARDQMAYLPRIPPADRVWLGEWLIRKHEVWVGEAGSQMVGFSATTPGWLDHLYVDPAEQNRGHGKRLLLDAMRRSAAGLQLWVFQKNSGARRFYERAGFRLVRLSDGRANMEHEPDALYAWAPGKGPSTLQGQQQEGG